MYLTREEFKELAWMTRINYDYRYRFDGLIYDRVLNKACLTTVKWLNSKLDGVFEEIYFKNNYEDLDSIYDNLIANNKLVK